MHQNQKSRNSNWSTWMDSTQQIQGFQPFSQRPHPGEKSGGFTGKIHHQILGGACTLSFIYGIDTPALNQLVRLFGFRNGPSTGSPHEYPPYSKVASWMFLLKPQSIAGWWFRATPLKNIKVNWDDNRNPIFLGKENWWQPNHQPDSNDVPNW